MHEPASSSRECDGDPALRRGGPWSALREMLSAPVSGASLGIFRIVFGAIMLLEAITLVRPSTMITGAPTPLDVYYAGSNLHFHFPYLLFQWLPVLPSGGMHLLVGVLAVASALVALGVAYRWAAATVFLVWGYFYAIESTRTYWMSYYYLELLFAFLMVWIPADRRYAWAVGGRKWGMEVPMIPRWALVLLQGQLVITYFYAGVAKLNADWLLDAMPVRYFLIEPHIRAIIEGNLPATWARSVLAFVQGPGPAFFLCYVGAIFDLAVGFLLLARRTRALGVVLTLIFHCTNNFFLFRNLEWFPLLGATTIFIFLEPDWPTQVGAWLRSPRWIRPDWNWFLAGGIALPIVGAALGWASRSRRSVPPPGKAFPLTTAGLAGVVLWLTLQTLLPLRAGLIPGDSRITFEGLSFSWRLKADVYRSSPFKLQLDDPALFPRDTPGKTTIQWTAWHGDKALYRVVRPAEINWALMPEVVVLFEPMTGERVLYNPFSGVPTPRTEAESRSRLSAIWRELYGREPEVIRRTVPLLELVNGYAAARRSKGEPMSQDPRQVLTQLERTYGRQGSGQLLPMLKRTDPFSNLERPAAAAAFLVVDDAAVLPLLPTKVFAVDRKVWKGSPATRPPMAAQAHVSEDALLIYLEDVSLADRSLLPAAYVRDDAEHLDRSPYVDWDYMRDMTVSQAMHASTQPFLLRRYARRVARLWEQENGRQPAVRALTEVSLNLRPPQQVVDPTVDLATVPVKLLGHNPWILDLQLERIPPAALQNMHK